MVSFFFLLESYSVYSHKAVCQPGSNFPVPLPGSAMVYGHWPWLYFKGTPPWPSLVVPHPPPPPAPISGQTFSWLVTSESNEAALRLGTPSLTGTLHEASADLATSLNLDGTQVTGSQLRSQTAFILITYLSQSPSNFFLPSILFLIWTVQIRLLSFCAGGWVSFLVVVLAVMGLSFNLLIFWDLIILSSDELLTIHLLNLPHVT